MSFQPRISDEEMQYFQFKARQMFLLRKEDHEWNQFCRRNKCTCCMCEGLSTNKSKEIGIQASTNVPTRMNRNINVRTGIQNRNLPQTLNEIKTRLDKLDLSLSQMQLPQNEAIGNQQLPDLQVPISSNTSGRNTLNDKRLEIIQNTLKGSLQRLQSTTAWKGKPIPSVNGQKKSSGFFLPRELQEQRIIARRVYLASLAKLGTKNKPTKDLSSDLKAKKSNKKMDQKPIIKSNKSFPKSRISSDYPKKHSLQQEKEGSIGSNIITAVQTSEIKDENIENAVDAIMDDLIGETVLTLNKIKHIKGKKTVEHNVGEIKNMQQTEPSETANQSDPHIQQKNHWEKIRGNLFKLKTAMSDNIVQNRNELSSFPDSFLSQNTIPKSVQKDSAELDKRTKLVIDSKSVKEISKQKKEFEKYLERISRTKKGNFDPWTLSNMVSESLLDDCILDICKELVDIPTSLITELYDREFLQSL